MPKDKNKVTNAPEGSKEDKINDQSNRAAVGSTDPDKKPHNEPLPEPGTSTSTDAG